MHIPEHIVHVISQKIGQRGGRPCSQNIDTLRAQNRINTGQKIIHEDYKRSSNDTAVNVVYDWDKAIIASWINDCDRAEEAVAYLKDIDPDEYERICYNIALERHSYIYIMFDTFKSNLNQTEYSDYKGRIVSALDRWAEYEYTQSGMARTTLQWLATL